MKRGVIAFALLASLLIGSFFNIRYLDGMIGELEAGVEETRALTGSGAFSEARRRLDAVIEAWESADGYTHIFIRHAEIDSTSDCFFELAQALGDGEEKAVDACCEKLLYHLESIRQMEHVTLRSVF